MELPALHGLRYVAAVHVAVFHFGGGLEGVAPSFVTHTGFVAVNLFFVLSGFVLAHTYVHTARPLDVRAFWRARFARIYPVYLLGFVLMAPFAWSSVQTPLVPLANLLLVQAWWAPWALTWNFPGWSISAEALFYLLFPALFAFAASAPLGRRRFAWVAAWLAGLALPFAYLAWNPDALGTVDVRSSAFWLDTLKFHPLARLPDFTVGVLTATLVSRGAARSGAWMSGLSAVGIVGALLLHERVPFVLLNNGLLTPLFAALLVGLARGGGLARVLASKPLVTLGKSSYVLYILHAPVALWLAAHVPTNTPWFAALLVLVLTLVSPVVWRVFEEPLRRRIAPRRLA